MRRSLLLLGLLLLPQLALGVEPEVVFTSPAEEAELSIKVWLDKGAYEAGERLRVHFIISRDCYVYIYDISPQGRVTLLFPNAFQKNNFLKAGRYALPDGRYSLVVEGEPGIEYVQAIASLKPVPVLVVPQEAYKEAPFPLINAEPIKLKSEVEREIEQFPSGEWAADWASFYLLEPGLAQIVIYSEPSGAQVYIDGRLAGSTPLAVSVAPGFVQILLQKEGYESWSERVHLERNEVEEIAAQMEVPSSPQTGGIEAGGRLLSLGFNLGIDWESLGVELGLLRWLRLGMAARFTGDGIPDHYEVEPPTEPWPDESIYNDGPETEVYLKLVLPLRERVALVVGGGLALQEQVHIATPPSGSALPQDVAIKPNGYRRTENYPTLLGGLLLRSGSLFLEFDYHSRRGWVLGGGIDF